MNALREFGYGHNLGPLPMVVWIGLLALLLMILAAGIAGLKKQVPVFRKVSVRVHRWIAIVGILLALLHLAIGLSTYI